MTDKTFLLIVALTILSSCKPSQVSIQISEIFTLENIPGASGMGIGREKVYIIGDNSPYLYLIDKEGKQVSKLPVYSDQDFIHGEIPKSLKPDFEAMEIVKGDTNDEILIFGSGSKSPKRDIFVHVILSEKPIVNTYSLVEFYDQLRNLPVMLGQELNIEAAATYDDKLLLFNRGKNLIFELNYSKFHKAIIEGNPVSDPVIHRFQLPSISGIESGFSGATLIPGTQTLLFTASVEDTPNAYDDGLVLGSFVGIIDMDKLGGLNTSRFALIKEDKKTLAIKVESIAVQQILGSNSAEILMVTDSDGAESLLLKAVLAW